MIDGAERQKKDEKGVYMIQKKFAGMANRAIRIVAACAVLLVLEGVCPYGGKAAAQSTASEAEKKAQSQLKEI